MLKLDLNVLPGAVPPEATAPPVANGLETGLPKDLDSLDFPSFSSVLAILSEPPEAVPLVAVPGWVVAPPPESPVTPPPLPLILPELPAGSALPPSGTALPPPAAQSPPLLEVPLPTGEGIGPGAPGSHDAPVTPLAAEGPSRPPLHVSQSGIGPPALVSSEGHTPPPSGNLIEQTVILPPQERGTPVPEPKPAPVPVESSTGLAGVPLDRAGEARVVPSNAAPPPTRDSVSPEWAHGFAERITVLTKDGSQVASLRLNPPELGHVTVRIALHSHDSSINFIASSESGREAIELAMPRLRQMLGDNGINLQSVEVSTGSPGGEADPQHRALDPVYPDEFVAGADALAEDSPSWTTVSYHDGLIDQYV